jgi:C1A family cysteine protease
MSIARFYGWKPPLPRPRLMFADHRAVMGIATFAPRLDMRAGDGPPYDQSQLGSCTGNAIAGELQFVRAKFGHPAWTPSRLGIYYETRKREGTIATDAGASLADTAEVVATVGFVPEAFWPYEIAKFADAPTKQSTDTERYFSGSAHGVSAHLALDNSAVAELKTPLAGGFPFVIGFTVYQSFESDAVAASGILPMPKPGEKILGGHAVMCLGWDDVLKAFLIRNSYGTGWGQGGYFWMPYDYATNTDLAGDAHTLDVDPQK